MKRLQSEEREARPTGTHHGRIRDKNLVFGSMSIVLILLLSTGSILRAQVQSGELRTMGNGDWGQLGSGLTRDYHSSILADSDVVKISAAGDSSFYIKADGTLMGTGKNDHGQIGDGTTTDVINPIVIDTGVVAVAHNGKSHTLYIKSDGTLMGMGSNPAGQLGDGTTTDRLTPIVIDNYVVAVAIGSIGERMGYSLYLKSDGTLMGMGMNLFGNLGDGTRLDQPTPIEIDTGVVAIAAGIGHSLYLKTDGTLMGMGWNFYGQIGVGTKSDKVTPVEIDTDVIAIAAGDSHSLYIKSDRTLMATGRNFSGAIGDGTKIDKLAPLAIDTDVVGIGAGGIHSLYIKSDGTLMAMGENEFGRLGDGTFTDRLTPVIIDTGVFAVDGGSLHSMYLKGPLFDWIMGGAPVDGLEDWYLSDWFGYYNTMFAPWLFHADHGFIYRHPQSTEFSTYIYDDAMGAWWWTKSPFYPPLFNSYPEVFLFDPPADLDGTDIGSEWVKYQLNSSNPREFVDVQEPIDVGPLYFGP